MFWGLVLEPAKRYTQKVQQSFHISQAALELSCSDSEPVQLVLEYEGSNYVLATLSKKVNLYQVPLDLNFNTGDHISFRTIGRGRVHLTGYHIMEDLESIGINDDEEDDDDDEDDDDSDPEDKIPEEIERNLLGKGKRKRTESRKVKKTKKTKVDGKTESETTETKETTMEGDVDGDDSGDSSLRDSSGSDVEDDVVESDNECEEIDAEGSENDSGPGNRPQIKKKTSSSSKTTVRVNGRSPKTRKIYDSTKSPTKPGKRNASTQRDMTDDRPTSRFEKSPKGEKKDQNKQELSSRKKVVEGGVIVEELTVGEGQMAKPGKMVQVHYVGRLQSNKKQFDATTQGPGFKFRLGKGEVIRGWDIGVNGMKVGGKRRITIPPHLAYGAKGAPPAIPPNSVLVFEVELKSIN